MPNPATTPLENKTSFNLLSCLFLFILSFSLYSNSLNNGFVWDDHILIEQSPEIRDITNLKAIFTSAPQSIYRPVRTLVYAAEYRLFNLNPKGYHFVNILLNVLFSVLLFLVFRRIFNHGLMALAAAALFSVHPVHSEAVAYVAGLADILASFFMLLSLLCWLGAEGKRTIPRLALSFLFFLAALFSKELAVVFPLFLLLFDFILLRRRLTGSLALRYLLFFAGSGFFLFVRFFLIHVGGQAKLIYHWTFPNVFPNVVRLIPHYLRDLIAPLWLCPDFKAFQLTHGIAHLSVIATLVACLAVAVCLILEWRRRPVVVVGVLWFALALLPVMQIVPIGTFCADRFLYLPSAGFCIVVVSLLGSLTGYRSGASRARFLLFLLPVAAIAVFWASRAVPQNLVWRNDETLYRKMACCAPNSDYAHNKLGMLLAERNEMGEAIIQLERANAISPLNATIMSNLANAYAKAGRIADANRFYAAVCRADPTHPTACLFTALANERLGRIDMAMDEYRSFLKLHPGNRFALDRVNAITAMKKLDRKRNSNNQEK